MVTLHFCCYFLPLWSCCFIAINAIVVALACFVVFVSNDGAAVVGTNDPVTAANGGVAVVATVTYVVVATIAAFLLVFIEVESHKAACLDFKWSPYSNFITQQNNP